jgi:hypothetical protein
MQVIEARCEPQDSFALAEGRFTLRGRGLIIE